MRRENEGAQFKQCPPYWVILAATGCFKGDHKDKAGKVKRGDLGTARAYFNEYLRLSASRCLQSTAVPGTVLGQTTVNRPCHSISSLSVLRLYLPQREILSWGLNVTAQEP